MRRRHFAEALQPARERRQLDRVAHDHAVGTTDRAIKLQVERGEGDDGHRGHVRHGHRQGLAHVDRRGDVDAAGRGKPRQQLELVGDRIEPALDQRDLRLDHAAGTVDQQPLGGSRRARQHDDEGGAGDDGQRHERQSQRRDQRHAPGPADGGTQASAQAGQQDEGLSLRRSRQGGCSRRPIIRQRAPVPRGRSAPCAPLRDRRPRPAGPGAPRRPPAQVDSFAVDAGHAPTLAGQGQQLRRIEADCVGVVVVHVRHDIVLGIEQRGGGRRWHQLGRREPADLAEAAHQMSALDRHPVKAEVAEIGIQRGIRMAGEKAAPAAAGRRSAPHAPAASPAVRSAAGRDRPCRQTAGTPGCRRRWPCCARPAHSSTGSARGRDPPPPAPGRRKATFRSPGRSRRPEPSPRLLYRAGGRDRARCKECLASCREQKKPQFVVYRWQIGPAAATARSLVPRQGWCHCKARLQERMTSCARTSPSSTTTATF